MSIVGHRGSALELWMNKLQLRAVRRIGVRARLKGRASIGGGGDVFIGDRFFMLSHPVRSHIFAPPGAVVTIGDDVQISYGAAIGARQRIDIGSNTVFGPFVVIMDNDYHKVGDRNAAGEIAPVRIGSNVRIGARVTILRGSVIGDGVRVISGSMVSGVVPSGATIGGVPARIVVASDATPVNSVDMPELVRSVLGLAERPHPNEGPAQIPAWDSLGTLRLLLAIEETFGVSLEEEEMHAARTVAALSAIVEIKRNISMRAAAEVVESA